MVVIQGHSLRKKNRRVSGTTVTATQDSHPMQTRSQSPLATSEPEEAEAQNPPASIETRDVEQEDEGETEKQPAEEAKEPPKRSPPGKGKAKAKVQYDSNDDSTNSENGHRHRYVPRKRSPQLQQYTDSQSGGSHGRKSTASLGSLALGTDTAAPATRTEMAALATTIQQLAAIVTTMQKEQQRSREATEVTERRRGRTSKSVPPRATGERQDGVRDPGLRQQRRSRAPPTPTGAFIDDALSNEEADGRRRERGVQRRVSERVKRRRRVVHEDDPPPSDSSSD
ncbi:hypothetical protein F444_09881, partial [Phytophthora nicotianae P1976]